MKWGVWVALVTPLEPGASCPRSPAAELQAAELQSCKSPYYVPTVPPNAALLCTTTCCTAPRCASRAFGKQVGSRIGKDRGASAMREALV